MNLCPLWHDISQHLLKTLDIKSHSSSYLLTGSMHFYMFLNIVTGWRISALLHSLCCLAFSFHLFQWQLLGWYSIPWKYSCVLNDALYTTHLFINWLKTTFFFFLHTCEMAQICKKNLLWSNQPNGFAKKGLKLFVVQFDSLRNVCWYSFKLGDANQAKNTCSQPFKVT